MPKVTSVVDVILAEAGGRTPFERLADMLNIASVIHNRAVTGRISPEDVVSVQSEFNAYGGDFPDGVEEMRKVAEQVWAQIQRTGPVHRGMFYATPRAVGNLPEGLQRIGAVNNGHVYFI